MKLKLPNRQQISAAITTLTEKGLVIVIIIYVVISIGRSVMKNYQINQRIANLETELHTLEQEKVYLDSLIAYYKTSTFKELKAREELGLQFPGEQVLAVPLEDEEEATSSKALALAVQQQKVEQPTRNYQKWFSYFFGS